jgi:hypothetical protein
MEPRAPDEARTGAGARARLSVGVRLRRLGKRSGSASLVPLLVRVVETLAELTCSECDRRPLRRREPGDAVRAGLARLDLRRRDRLVRVLLVARGQARLPGAQAGARLKADQSRRPPPRHDPGRARARHSPDRRPLRRRRGLGARGPRRAQLRALPAGGADRREPVPRGCLPPSAASARLHALAPPRAERRLRLAGPAIARRTRGSAPARAPGDQPPRVLGTSSRCRNGYADERT